MFKITKESAIIFLKNIIIKIKNDDILLYSLNKLKNILIDEFNFLKKSYNNLEKQEEIEEEKPKRPSIYRKRRKKKKNLLKRE